MSKPVKVMLLLSAVVASFLAGAWYNRSKSSDPKISASRQILYYHDPMHPAYKSDKPGIAPDCGMQLEPVFAEGASATSEINSASVPSPLVGAIQISAEKQQLIGIRVATVEKREERSNLRTIGRIVADETRIYKITAVTNGWIRDLRTITTGNLVKKDDVLISFYSPEFLSAQKAYLYALSALDNFQANNKEPESQIDLTKASIQQYVDALKNLGMGEIQIAEIGHTRQVTQDIRMTAPITGMVIARSVYPGQRFEKGTEFYQIADLSHIWVVVDIFEGEAQFVKSAKAATFHYQGQTFQARLGNALPQFDSSTRTLKFRFETGNPGLALRPDMFVDVEFPVNLPASVTVPAEAVIDSGQRKTVYVNRGAGYFDPRQVETGWRFGDRVQIVKGLEPGESIVISGNFLIDSESRLRAAAQPPSEQDPKKYRRSPRSCLWHGCGSESVGCYHHPTRRQDLLLLFQSL